MWITFHRVIHIGLARQRIGLGELSTFPHTPTTTTTSFKLILVVVIEELIQLL